jgi:hypothetical protein
MDSAQLVERFRLEPALPELPTQGECLVRMLPCLVDAARQKTDRAEPRDPEGLSAQRADTATFPERLFKESTPLGSAPRKRRCIAEGRRGG